MTALPNEPRTGRMSAPLQLLDKFPRISGETVNHGTVTLPDDIPAGGYGIILTFRGHW